MAPLTLKMADPDFEAVREELREETSRALLQRVRIILWIALCAIPPYALIDSLVYPGVVFPLVVLRTMLGVVTIAGLLILQRHPTGAWAVRVGVMSFAVMCSTSAVSGALVGDDHVTQVLAVALVMGSASLLPWGPSPHIATTVMMLAASLWNTYAVHGTIPAPNAYAGGALIVVSAVSIYLAYQLDRDRSALARHNLVRKRAEEALRASEDRYRRLFENASDGVYTIDLEGNLAAANRAAERMTGYSRHEVVGKPFWSFFPPDQLEVATEVTKRQLAGEQDPIRFETEIVAKDGHRVPIEVVSQTMMQEGRPIGIQGVARDITERKKAEAALAASRRELEQEAQISAALARVGQELIASLDTSALLDRLCRITTEVIGCDCCHTYFLQPEEDVFVPVAGYGDTPERWEAIQVFKIPRALLAGLEQGLLHGVMAQLPGIDAAAIAVWYGVTVALALPLRRGGEIIGMLAATYRGRQEPFTPEQQRTARGVAQLASFALQNARLVEELERASRVKSDFMATMSHELRTPLNLIIGYADLLLEGEFGGLAPQQEDSLRRVDKSARNLLDLINNTLDLSRLETGRLPVDLKEIGVADFLDEIAAETRLVFEKPGVRFAWQVAPQLAHVRTDPVKLRLIIKNLIANAAKFTEQGSVTVAVARHGAGVEFAVADTGIGIEPEARALIFEPFHQVHNATGPYGGVGLGLYIVRRLLDMLEGTIAVESEVGRGSTFRVWIPASK